MEIVRSTTSIDFVSGSVYARDAAARIRAPDNVERGGREGRTVINHGGFGSRNGRSDARKVVVDVGWMCGGSKSRNEGDISPPLSRFFSLSPSITGEMVSSPLWPGRRGPGGGDQERGLDEYIRRPTTLSLETTYWLTNVARTRGEYSSCACNGLPWPPPLPSSNVLPARPMLNLRLPSFVRASTGS